MSTTSEIFIKKLVQSKQSFTGRKLAKSGHPGFRPTEKTIDSMLSG
jgi:hypothetical protein